MAKTRQSKKISITVRVQRGDMALEDEVTKDIHGLIKFFEGFSNILCLDSSGG